MVNSLKNFLNPLRPTVLIRGRVWNGFVIFKQIYVDVYVWFFSIPRLFLFDILLEIPKNYFVAISIMAAEKWKILQILPHSIFSTTAKARWFLCGHNILFFKSSDIANHDFTSYAPPTLTLGLPWSEIFWCPHMRTVVVNRCPHMRTASYDDSG